ncbi:TadA family conjugal transfer-associated ATPase [Trueperella pyogenes]|uniref:TadA family conjugal transfer-associated ATPase n=1 Tax=Trueperella pyogenes TaxID=1661 RepID=UPI0024332612|nr:TadA family conjugal transfer-associated ATPase [Trueperella pyogenes]MCI7689562.1 TadA family conjugal transfer-associated ATPase [Trueperella pyogenes]WHU60623.1 TadA family conjugal transfer-associated ATPase [Trueperella pyogenes]
MILNEQQLAAIRRRLAAGENLRGALAAVPGAIFTADVAAVDAQIRRELIGAGPVIAPLLEDGEVTDVVVNGVQVWIDRGAGMERIEDELESEEAARALAVRLAASCGQRLDDASPIVDGTFPSGVRLHAVIPPLSAEGTLISLRTHRARVFTLAELQAGGSVASEVARVVRLLVGQRANVLISGATGAGKTTFLNAMLSLIGAEQRILVIEESAELRPNHPHVIHLQVRKANVQGAGEVTMSDLVRAAMRMRPDRIVLGECRGAEVRDVLGALNTGHEGGWATIHANSTADIPARLVALGALAGMNEATVTAQAAAGLDAAIHVRRAGGQRFVSEIAVFARRGGELLAPIALRASEPGQHARVEYAEGWPALAARLGLETTP